jgi:hypothetical protein
MQLQSALGPFILILLFVSHFLLSPSPCCYWPAVYSGANGVLIKQESIHLSIAASKNASTKK